MLPQIAAPIYGGIGAGRSPGATGAAMAAITARVASDKTTVAVIMTTYNHAHFLLEAIHSVLAQTHPADEILVVDDGSSDDPAAVVSLCASVKLIRQNNQGLSAARNAGLKAVRSDKVVFLDADDRLLPNAIAAGLACYANDASCGFVYGGYRLIDQHGRPFGKDVYNLVGPQPYRDMLRGNQIGMHATVMYDRARLVASGGFDPAVERCEDYDVYLRMSRDGPIASHPQFVAEYRWHGGNMSSNHREMLDWALRVHARHEQTARALGAAAGDWQEGRRRWRSYYASEMLGATRRRWASERSPGAAARGVVQALCVSPGTIARALAQSARRHLRKRLPAASGQRRALGAVRFGDLDNVAPISDDFGFERGTPIDRFYIEQFLQRNAGDIAGRALEVGDDAYCRRFGGQRITQQDVLHVSADNPTATLVGDLSRPGTLPPAAFDCLVLTQTLHLIFDMHAAVAEMHRGLKPGGMVLLTVPGITRIDRGEWGADWFWSLTPAAATRLFGEVFGADNVRVESHGNVFAATAFLHGLAVEEVDAAKLTVNDACFPVIVTVRARKS
jgi:glycosyltransferase involved in cell wall biosynthesis/SAM-dependent methyltransferase